MSLKEQSHSEAGVVCRPVESVDGAERIRGRTEMADRIRAFDWASTALGPVSEWPETSVFLINAALATLHPMLLMVGPELIQIYNDAFAPILMNRHPAALGQRGRELWRDTWPVNGSQLEAALYEGKPFLQKQGHVPILRNGKMQEAYFDYSYSPAFNSDGTVAAIVVICQEVTTQVVGDRERGMVEAALHAERARLLRALQQAPILFALLEGPEHRIVMGNESYLRLVGNRDVVGRPLQEAIPEAREQGYLAVLDQVFTTGEPFMAMGATFSNAASDGKPSDQRTLDYVCQPWREEDGSISGVIAIGVDTTERSRAQQALLQTEKLAAVGRLASTIAHEINNPLEAVTNLLYLAQHSETLQESQGFLRQADEELRRMSAIATQTLQFNKQSTDARSVKCTELLRSVKNLYESRIRNANIRVEERSRSDEPVFCFDGEIRQVLNNLVSNAIDAMQGTGGRLLLRSRMTVDRATGRPGVMITVADTGPGISEANLEHIFEPFFTTKGASGTGLGLWVSQDIVSRHQGKLRVRSCQDEGHRGTVFTLFLPHRIEKQ